MNKENRTLKNERKDTSMCLFIGVYFVVKMGVKWLIF